MPTKEDKQRDEILRRLLNTPPDPKQSKDKDKSEEKEKPADQAGG